MTTPDSSAAAAPGEVPAPPATPGEIPPPLSPPAEAPPPAEVPPPDEPPAEMPVPNAQSGSGGSDVPPDRLAINPRSPHFNGDLLQRGVGIRFKGTVRKNVEEYCISEGWVRVQAGKSMDRKGQPLTIKLSGPVEAWYEDLGEGAPVAAA